MRQQLQSQHFRVSEQQRACINNFSILGAKKKNFGAHQTHQQLAMSLNTALRLNENFGPVPWQFQGNTYNCPNPNHPVWCFHTAQCLSATESFRARSTSLCHIDLESLHSGVCPILQPDHDASLQPFTFLQLLLTWVSQ